MRGKRGGREKEHVNKVQRLSPCKNVSLDLCMEKRQVHIMFSSFSGSFFDHDWYDVLW